MLKRYRSHRAALMKLFPEIGLERDKLQSKNYGNILFLFFSCLFFFVSFFSSFSF